MAPPSATSTETNEFTHSLPKVDAPTTDPGHPEGRAAIRGDSKMKLPGVPIFEDKYQEREYQKGRLALAFRIFAKLGYDEGVAGHITLRVFKNTNLQEK